MTIRKIVAYYLDLLAKMFAAFLTGVLFMAVGFGVMLFPHGAEYLLGPFVPLTIPFGPEWLPELLNSLPYYVCYFAGILQIVVGALFASLKPWIILHRGVRESPL